jgi:translation initiation factor 2 alpha subunit (eIF-2alpha)
VHSPWGAGIHFSVKLDMKIKKRKPYNNMLDAKLMKSLRILAAKQDKRQNDLLEEAIQDLLKKYGKEVPPNRAY